MAPKTKFLTNDALTRKRWAKDLFAVMLPGVEFNYLVGKDTNSIVQMKTELGKGEGDQVTFGIRLPLTGQGVPSDGTVEGNEEKLRFRDFAVTIEELNHAVDTGGRMEEQRVPYDLVMEGKNGLSDWWQDKLSDFVINCLAGNTGFTFAGLVMGGSTPFGSAFTAPTTGQHLFMNGKASEALLTSADTIDLTFLDALKQRAEVPVTNSFKIRPLSMGGKNKYRVILHNYVFDALRQNTNIGQWGDLLRAAGKLGMPEVEIEYNGMMISKSERIPRMVAGTGDYDGVYRCLFLGAQSAVWAWGGAGESKSTTMSFVPYTKDAKRFLNIRGGGIFGIKKTTFTISGDYGCLVGSCWGDRLQ